jgi:hypothetical protein
MNEMYEPLYVAIIITLSMLHWARDMTPDRAFWVIHQHYYLFPGGKSVKFSSPLLNTLLPLPDM